MEELETLVIDRDGGIVTITLNRPEKKNAANGSMWQELLETFRAINDDDAVRVVVVTGSGGEFCSGADLTDAGKDRRASTISGMRRVGDVALALHRLPKPTIAKVRGVAVGAGANLALGCDLIVASETARFSQIFHRRNLSIDNGGSWILPRLIGLHKAKELAFFADIISAQEAADFGIVNRVVPDGELDAFVDDWARRLEAMPPLAMSMTKLMLNNSIAGPLSDAVEDEARSQTVNFNSADMAEAIAAFTEKREPNFKGR